MCTRAHVREMRSLPRHWPILQELGQFCRPDEFQGCGWEKQIQYQICKFNGAYNGPVFTVEDTAKIAKAAYRTV